MLFAKDDAVAAHNHQKFNFDYCIANACTDFRLTISLKTKVLKQGTMSPNITTNNQNQVFDKFTQ